MDQASDQDLPLVELKARAYDTIAQIEFLKVRLNELNGQIEQRHNKNEQNENGGVSRITPPLGEVRR